MSKDRGNFALQWRLEGRYVVTRDGDQVYVRTLVDIGSHEFTASSLSYGQRLQIIEAVGEDLILNAMAKIAGDMQRAFSIEHQGRADIALLRRWADKENRQRQATPTGAIGPGKCQP